MEAWKAVEGCICIVLHKENKHEGESQEQDSLELPAHNVAVWRIIARRVSTSPSREMPRIKSQQVQEKMSTLPYSRSTSETLKEKSSNH